MEKRIVTILGAGAWGSVLGHLVSCNGHLVKLWSRRTSQTLEEAIGESNLILSAVSMKGVPEVAAKLKDIGISETTTLITATKGLAPNTNQTPSQIWRETFPKNPIVVLSGPNLSKEIQQNLPAATVVASNNFTAAEQIQNIFSSEHFRVYINDDPLGTELGGTLKNVIAIAAGVCDGLHLGTNAKAALLTRALPEIVRVGKFFGAKAETFFGLSGLGDLLATCNSSLSRNYQVGYGLAQGKSLSEILASLEGTAEGVNTTRVLFNLAHQQQISVPITHQVYLLLEGEVTPQETVKALMAREMKPEWG